MSLLTNLIPMAILASVVLIAAGTLFLFARRGADYCRGAPAGPRRRSAWAWATLLTALSPLGLFVLGLCSIPSDAAVVFGILALVAGLSTIPVAGLAMFRILWARERRTGEWIVALSAVAGPVLGIASAFILMAFGQGMLRGD